MSKTKEELDALKEEVEAVNEKLQELTEEELEQVSGGAGPLFALGIGHVFESADYSSRVIIK